MDDQTKAKQDHFTSSNPIAGGVEGGRTVRALSECPMPQLGMGLRGIIQTMMENTDKWTSSASVDKALFDGTLGYMQGANKCDAAMNKRVVAKFDTDETLVDIAKNLAEVEDESNKVQARMQELYIKGIELLQRRWDHVVKHNGLSPDKYCYYINEESACVEEWRVDCTGCKIITDLKQVQKTLETAMPPGGSPNGK